MDTYLKELDSRLAAIITRLKDDFRGIRSGRPSVEFLENLKVNYFDQWLTIKQLGSLSLLPPREVRVAVWDKNSAPAVAKAIEDARAGFTVQSEGALVRASLSALSDERREEMGRFAKKTAEGARIEVRSARDEAQKKLKAAADRKEITEDQSFSGKEKMQQRVDEANGQIEKMVEDKLKEISA